MVAGLISTYGPASPPYKLPSYSWDVDLTLSGDVTCSGTLTVTGTLTFGDAAVDSFVLKGRLSTMTAAGAAIDIGSSYTYGEGIELRYQVTDWTGVGSSFKGMYLRSECATNAATAKSIYGMELYGVCNNVTMTTGSLWGALVYAYNKGASAVTINNMYAVQAELTWDAGRTGDCTISTEAAVLLAKTTGGRVADYTKIHGIILRWGEMDGDSQTFGKGIRMEDDGDMSGTSTLTTGLDIGIGCTNGIHLSSASMTYGLLVVDGFTGQAIKVGSLSSTTPGTGCEISDSVVRAVDIHADDNNAAIDSATTSAALRARAMYYASAANEAWGIHGLAKLGEVARTANVVAGVVGAFESTGTCSTATGSGNTYCAGVMGRVGTGGSFTIGAGTYVACVLAFGNNANSNAFTNTGYHAFHAALTDVGTAEVFDVGLFIEDSAATVGIDVGNATTGINMGTYSGTGIVLEGSLMAIDLTATMTGASAINGSEFNITDSTTASSGYSRGIWLSMTAGGAKTGTAETNGMGIDLTVTGNSPFARALTLYTNATGTTTIGTMNALDIYMDDEASGVTQTAKRAINIGIDHGNDKGTCDIMVMRCHGGTIDNIFKFTDTSGTPYTNFISIDGLVSPFHSGSLDDSGSGDILCDAYITIDIGGTPYYLALYNTTH